MRRRDELAATGLLGLVLMLFGIALQLGLLAAAVWVVVWVLRATGVIG